MSSSSSSPALPARFSLAGRFSCWYCSFLAAAAKLQSPFLLFVRLYWGWQFMQTGWGKLHHIARVTEFFASLHVPAPQFMAPFIGGVEFFGGLLLILGLSTRLTGLVLAVNMLTAYLAADREALSSFLSDPGKFYAADPFTFLFASLIVLIFGAGVFSLDYLLAHRRRS